VPHVAAQQRVDMGFGQKRHRRIDSLSHEPLRDDRKLNTIHSSTVVRTPSITARTHPRPTMCLDETVAAPPEVSPFEGLTRDCPIGDIL